MQVVVDRVAARGARRSRRSARAPAGRTCAPAAGPPPARARPRCRPPARTGSHRPGSPPSCPSASSRSAHPAARRPRPSRRRDTASPGGSARPRWPPRRSPARRGSPNCAPSATSNGRNRLPPASARCRAASATSGSALATFCPQRLLHGGQRRRHRPVDHRGSMSRPSDDNVMSLVLTTLFTMPHDVFRSGPRAGRSKIKIRYTQPYAPPQPRLRRLRPSPVTPSRRYRARSPVTVRSSAADRPHTECTRSQRSKMPSPPSSQTEAPRRSGALS